MQATEDDWQELFDMVSEGHSLAEAIDIAFKDLAKISWVTRELSRQPKLMALYKRAKTEGREHKKRRTSMHIELPSLPSTDAQRIRFDEYQELVNAARRESKISGRTLKSVFSEWNIPSSWRWLGVRYDDIKTATSLSTPSCQQAGTDKKPLSDQE